MSRVSLSTLTGLLLVVLGLWSVPVFAQSATVGSYQLVSQRRITLTVSEFTYQASLINHGPDIQSATATVSSLSPSTVVVDGTLGFGAIGAGLSGGSTDTFSIRQNRTTPFDPANLVWNVVVVTGGQPGAATALRVRALGGVRAGDPFSVVVEAVNAANTIDPGFAGPVTLSVGSAVPSNGQIAFDAVVSPSTSAGVFTFNGLSLSNAADGYAVIASSPGLTSGVSNGFNVTAHHLTVATAVSNHRAGTPVTLTVEARDNTNQRAENFAGNVQLNAAAVGGSNFNGGAASVAAVAGQAIASGLVLNNAANGYAVTASSAGPAAPNNGISNAFNVTASHLTVLTIANVRAGDPFNLVVEARDANNALAENFAAASGLTLSNLSAAVVASGQTAFDAAIAPSFAPGSATFSGLSISNAADGYTVSASSDGMTDASNGFNVTAHHLTVVTAVSNHRAGTPLTLTVEARDNTNARAENFAGNVQLNAAAVGGSNFNGGAASVAAVAGQAIASGLVLNNAANGYAVTASSAGPAAPNNGISNAFNVTASHLTVLTIANVRAGDPFDLVVEARDANNALAENFAAASGLTLSNLSAAVVASGQTAFDAAIAPSFAPGSATFSGLSISNAADGYTVSASSDGMTDASNGFNVTAHHLTVVTAVSNHRAGTPLTLTVEARDNTNARAENFAGNVQLNAAAVGGSNFNGGAASVAAVAGQAIASGLVLNNAANGYLITAGATALNSGVSNAFNVTASHLTVLAVPNVQAGSPFSIVVEARDANNALAENFFGSPILSNLASAAPANGQTAFDAAVAPTVGAGIATFNGLSISNAADGYTFTAGAPGLTSGISNAFNVTAHHLAFTSTVASERAGTAFAVSVEARDNTGQRAENFTGVVSLNAAATGGSNFNGGTKTGSATAGSVTIANLRLNNAASGYHITATSPGLNQDDSNAFAVTATHLAVLTIANVRAGDAFSLVVEARDANNALAENFSGSPILSNLASAVPANGQTAFDAAVAPTVGAGIATFNGLSISNAADGYTVTAAASGLTSGISNAFNVTAHHLAFTSTVASERAGTAFAVSVEARDNTGQRAENFTGVVSLNAAATGGSNFNGGTKTGSATAGSVTIGNLRLNNAASGYHITATSTGPNDADSNAFAVLATHLAVLTVPNQVAGTPFSATVEARDANNGVAENFFGTISLNAAAPGGGNLVGAPLSAAATAGVRVFTGLVLNTAADGYSITATAIPSGLTSGTSNLFAVTEDGEAQALALDLSQVVIGGGDTIAVSPHGAETGNRSMSSAPTVYQVLAGPGSSGTAPFVIGDQIVTAADTRGGFVLRATVDGAPAAPDLHFAVTETAAQSRNAGTLIDLAARAGAVERALDELARAFADDQLDNVPAIAAALQTARSAVVVTGRHAIQRGRAVAPESGFLPTPEDLSTAGLTETEDDVTFGQLLPQITGILEQVAASSAGPTTVPDAAAVTMLRLRTAQLDAVRARLVALKVTPYAVVKHLSSLNDAIRNVLPTHLRAVSGAAGDLMAAKPGTTPELVEWLAASSTHMNLVNGVYGALMAQIAGTMVTLADQGLLTDYRNPAPAQDSTEEVWFIGGASSAPVDTILDGFDPTAIRSFDDLDAYFGAILDALQAAGVAFDQVVQPAGEPAAATPGRLLRFDRDTGAWSSTVVRIER